MDQVRILVEPDSGAGRARVDNPCTVHMRRARAQPKNCMEAPRVLQLSHRLPRVPSACCNPPATIFALVMGICVQCGTTSNPCRCKVVGPTLGFLAFVAAAMVEWPLGAVVYCFRHVKGRHIMAHPAMVVYPSVSNSIPI
ncbi:hypothetical protein SAY86_019634 [Trapa natans]|uniref:Uncharacterized protein n=1 Tax=Trapa natans TaxID=22666 RepID=A0AAN7R4W2_TRANT|nr:hypothetical protein SAY86_019634 [Trapa natans]